VRILFVRLTARFVRRSNVVTGGNVPGGFRTDFSAFPLTRPSAHVFSNGTLEEDGMAEVDTQIFYR